LWQKDVSNAISNSDLTLEDLSHGIPGGRSLVCKTVLPDNTTDVSNIISGTYVHSLLIPHIACWISVDFALKVSEVINGYIVYEYKRKAEDLEVQLEITAGNVAKLEEVVAEKDELINGKDNLINTAHNLLATANDLIDNQSKTIIDVCGVVEKKKKQLDVWASSHGFTMARLNNPNAKMPYYAIRRKRVNMSGAIKKLRAKHPHSIMVFQTSYVPNPVNLYNRLKTCGILKFKGNYCNSVVPESELITKLGELYDIVD
jgi:Protein of unknown function (DUF3627)/KilA-N domain